MKLFFSFVFISGLGWVIDVALFSFFTHGIGITPAYANFISSIVGVTYVWIVSLNRLFECRELSKSIYLMVYWSYQIISIFTYSVIISYVAATAFNSEAADAIGFTHVLSAKIIITLPNLLTNFIFMSVLTKFMRSSNKQRHLQ
jgi:hypothetical protein